MICVNKCDSEEFERFSFGFDVIFYVENYIEMMGHALLHLIIMLQIWTNAENNEFINKG